MCAVVCGGKAGGFTRSGAGFRRFDGSGFVVGGRGCPAWRGLRRCRQRLYVFRACRSDGADGGFRGLCPPFRRFATARGGRVGFFADGWFCGFVTGGKTGGFTCSGAGFRRFDGGGLVGGGRGCPAWRGFGSFSASGETFGTARSGTGFCRFNGSGFVVGGRGCPAWRAVRGVFFRRVGVLTGDR